MRPLWLSSWVFCAALSGLTSPVSAIDVQWISVGSPGNPCESQRTGFRSQGCFGAVGNTYEISQYAQDGFAGRLVWPSP